MVWPSAAHRLPRSGLAWTGLTGLFFAVLGGLASFALLQNDAIRVFASASGVATEVLPFLVALSSFLVAGTSWWVVVERPRRLTRGRGALVGLLTGLLAHPVLWFLAFTYLDLQSGRVPWQDGSLGFVLLVTIYSLGFTGTVTVAVGIFGGLVVSLARERTVDWEGGDQQSLRKTFATNLVNGVVTLLAILITTLTFPALLASALVVVAVSVVVFRRLPVVRTFFVRGYYRANEDPVATTSNRSSLTNRSFVLRHAVGMVGLGVVYYLAFLGYGELVDYLYYSFLSNSSPIFPRAFYRRIFDNSIYAYPVFFVAGSLLVALALNRRWTRWEPSRSPRRAALEWTVFLALAVAVYTGTVVVWYRFAFQ